jgi:MFS family permease
VFNADMALLAFLRDNLRWLMAGALLMFLSAFGQTFFVAVFAGDIRATFGLSHGAWGAIYAAGTAAAAAVMVWAGGLADRMRSGPLAAGSLALLAVACLAMAANASVLLLPVVVFLLRLAGQGMVPHIGIVAISRWFVATRGRALAIATLGFQLAEAAMPLGFATGKELLGWRTMWVIGAGILIAAIPLALWLFAQDRVPRAGEPATGAVPGLDGRHWRRAEVLRLPLFWALLPGMAGFPAMATVFWFQQVQYAAEKGWPHLSLVAILPLGTAAFVVGTAAFGWALDRFGARALLPIYLLPLAAGFAVASATTSLPVAVLAVMLFGLSGGGQATVASATWVELFGTAHVGSVRAMVTSFFVLGSALGPLGSGLLLDAGVPLATQYAGFSVWFLGSCALIAVALARRPSRLAQVDVERA